MLQRCTMILCLLLVAASASAQDVDTAWVRTYNGTGNNTDVAYAVELDGAGNVYVTGQSWGSGTSYDYATVKYDPNGNTLWERRYNGPVNGNDVACAMELDGSGNAYVTGRAWNGSNYDYVTISYDQDGTQRWVQGYVGMGATDIARDVAVDVSGNAYVTGYSVSQPSGDMDYATIKYDTNGGVVWVRRFNGPIGGDDSTSAIAVDNSGNAYVTGQSKFSPVRRVYGTVKYGSDGTFLWARFYGGTAGSWDYAYDLAVDDSGNCYVTGRLVNTGTNADYGTIKYAPDGTENWVRIYNNGAVDGSDFGRAITVDDSGNVYVTGQSAGSGTATDYCTIKYDTNGNLLWERRYNGTANSSDTPYAITVDSSGNVYVTGSSIGSGTSEDIVTIKYDASGDELWVQRYNGPANITDQGTDIAVDNFGNVHVTGLRDYGFNTGDYTTIKYWQNYPPGVFSLLSPEDVSSVPSPVSFDWEDATDPDPWDTVKYDLYVSTSPVFHLDSTNIYDSLLTSEYSDNFATGTYYWKVGAYDNHAEVWSNQTWSFAVVQPLFGPAVDYEVGDFPHSVFCADLDGDGDLDLATANHESQNVSVLKNNGNGTFAGAVNYTVATQPLCVFCGELDGDGDLDLAVSCVSGGVFILKNNGDGTFVNVGNYPGSGLRFLFCADLDEDDDLDIVVTTVATDEVFILMNNGDGTFVNSGSYTVGDEPGYAFCTDLDADGDLDLAVANVYSDDISILKNDGDGNFQPKVDYPVEHGPHCVFPMDLDGDGDLDLAVANGYEDSGDSVSVLMNNGDGTFANAINYKVGPRAFYLFSSDVDGDADFDLAAANSWSSSVSILKNNEDGTFSAPVDCETPSGPMYPFSADLDGDGDFDLAVTIGFSGHVVSVLENLTQVPANQPPHPFPLLSPEDGSWTPQVLVFDWRTPYDPNFGDQIRYDLYISTVPGFEPDLTTIYSDLTASRDTVSLGVHTYYWKVKAYDNWGAETWSSQTWSFTTISPTALVGYWTFEEGDGDTAHDSSGYGNDGTLKNEAGWADGLPPLGWALDLDGTNDYVRVPDCQSLDIGGPFTIMTWINPRSLPTQHISFVNKYLNYLFQTANSGPGRLRVTFVDHELESPDNVLGVSIWQHIAAVWDGEYFRLYRDGIEVAYEYEGPATPPTADYPLLIGCEREYWQFFDGMMDEVKIYRRALSLEEIGTEFESGFIRGDANADGVIDLGDVVWVLNYLFKNGLSPDPVAAGDANCDGLVDLADAIHLLNYLFKGGESPGC